MPKSHYGEARVGVGGGLLGITHNLLEFDRELHTLVQLVQASSSICEATHVQHQDLR